MNHDKSVVVTEMGVTYAITSNNKTLTEMDLPKEVTTFAIPEGVTAISADVLYGPGLIELTLPLTLHALPEGIFANLARNKKPVQLHLPSCHPTMRLDEGCLIVSKEDEMVLIASFSDQREMRVPEGVSILGRRCFAGRMFERLILPQSLRCFHGEAFDECLPGELTLLSTGTKVLFPSERQLRTRLMKGLDGENCTYNFAEMDRILCQEYMNLTRFSLLIWRLSQLPYSAALKQRFHQELLSMIPKIIREGDVRLFQQLLQVRQLSAGEMDAIFAQLIQSHEDPSAREMMTLLVAARNPCHHSTADSYSL